MGDRLRGGFCRDAADRWPAAAGSSAVAQEPYAEPRPARREHAAAVLRLALGRLPSTTPRIRTERGPIWAPYAANGWGRFAGPHEKVKSHFGICGPTLGPVPDRDPAVPKLG